MHTTQICVRFLQSLSKEAWNPAISISMNGPIALSPPVALLIKMSYGASAARAVARASPSRTSHLNSRTPAGSSPRPAFSGSLRYSCLVKILADEQHCQASVGGATVPRCSDDLRTSGNELVAGCETNPAGPTEHNRFLACKARHLRTRLVVPTNSCAAQQAPGYPELVPRTAFHAARKR